MKLMIINGPNLNMLGIREKEIYGIKGYVDIFSNIESQSKRKGHELKILQSNIEGEIINFIQRAYVEKFDGIIINPGAFTHYSYAIYDAIKSINIPTIEVHMSNVHAREEFRRNSVIAPACIGSICGFGEQSYILAIDALDRFSKESEK